MKKLSYLFIFLLLSCNQVSSEKDDNSENQKKFEANMAKFNGMIDAFAAEDHEQFMGAFADSLKWSGPDKINMSQFDSKETLSNALKGYMAAYDDHALKNTRFFAGSAYSSMEASNNPDVIRVYGDWHHKHTETGVDVSHKWMAVLFYNKDGHIHEFWDYFDATGFSQQHLQ
jgi:hypothetical protein